MSEYAGALDSADAMDLFMASASAYPLLSPELVVAIAKRYHR